MPTRPTMFKALACRLGFSVCNDTLLRTVRGMNVHRQRRSRCRHRRLGICCAKVLRGTGRVDRPRARSLIASFANGINCCGSPPISQLNQVVDGSCAGAASSYPVTSMTFGRAHSLTQQFRARGPAGLTMRSSLRPQLPQGRYPCADVIGDGGEMLGGRETGDGFSRPEVVISVLKP